MAAIAPNVACSAASIAQEWAGFRRRDGRDRPGQDRPGVCKCNTLIGVNVAPACRSYHVRNVNGMIAQVRGRRMKRKVLLDKALWSGLAVALAGGGVAAQAYEQGDFIVRAGAVMVDPDADSEDINRPGVPTLNVDVDDDTQLSLIGAYMVTDQVAVELLAATPFEHDVVAAGAGVDLDAGTVKHLPPTLSVQWYPRGGASGWQPYIGLGVNYTFIFDEDVDRELAGALGAILGATRADLDLDDSFGLTAQAGVDIPLGGNWALNAGVWYMDIDTTATIKTDVGNVKFDVDIDPWVYNVGIAYRF